MGLAETAGIASWLGQVATAQRGLSCVLGVGDSFTLRHLRDAGYCLAAQHPDRSGICFGYPYQVPAFGPGQRAA